MAETMLLIPVRTSRQGTSLNAGKLKDDYQDETSTIEIHSDDMTRMGLKKGDNVRMISANGAECVVSCKPQKGGDAVPGLVFMAYGPVSSQFMEADTAGTGMPISKQLEITLEGPLAADGSVMDVAPALSAGGSDLASSPLSAQQIGLLNSLAESQLSATQAVWLSGYFAGLSGSGVAPGEFASAMAQPNAASLPPMTILFGSETGNGESLAEDLHEKAKARGFNVTLADMMSYEFDQLTKETLLFVIVSTQGEGDPPLSANKLHTYLKGDDVPRLENLKFAVFALGDSSYEFYCQTGKDFDGFLENLGAERIMPRVDADVDFEEPAEEWMQAVLETYQDLAGDSTATATSDAATDKKKSGYSKTNPYHASVLLNTNLNGEGSAKETRHIEIDLGDSELSYEPGAALGVYPLNNPAYVEELLQALSMSGDESVNIGKETVNLRQACIEILDVTALSRLNMQKYADLTGSEDLKTLLDDAHKEEFNDYTWGRQILDLVLDYPYAELTAQDFVDVLRKIPARLYSIASSITAHPGQVHLLVGAVRYHSYDRDREGVCSTFLAGRVAEDQKLAIYVQPNKHFHLPTDPNTPVIMVGPGTGLAPFRAFLEERRATGAGGKNWLFFGDQHEKSDFLYADEMRKMLDDSLLTHLSLAFSRDQKEKIYVQNRIMEHAAEIYAWLEEGAYFYICGDAERMAKDVHNAIIETVVQEGGKSSVEAEDYVNALLDARRYQRDVY